LLLDEKSFRSLQKTIFLSHTWQPVNLSVLTDGNEINLEGIYCHPF